MMLLLTRNRLDVGGWLARREKAAFYFLPRVDFLTASRRKILSDFAEGKVRLSRQAGMDPFI